MKAEEEEASSAEQSVLQKTKNKNKICNHYKTIILLAPLPPLLTSSPRPRPYPPKQKCLEHKRYSCMKYIYKIIKKIIKK